jgi:hypothetical protein
MEEAWINQGSTNYVLAWTVPFRVVSFDRCTRRESVVWTDQTWGLGVNPTAGKFIFAEYAMMCSGLLFSGVIWINQRILHNIFIYMWFYFEILNYHFDYCFQILRHTWRRNCICKIVLRIFAHKKYFTFFVNFWRKTYFTRLSMTFMFKLVYLQDAFLVFCSRQTTVEHISRIKLLHKFLFLNLYSW